MTMEDDNEYSDLEQYERDCLRRERDEMIAEGERHAPAIFPCENGVGVWEVRSEEHGDEVFDTRREAEARLREVLAMNNNK